MTKLERLLKGTDYEDIESVEALREIFPELPNARWNRLVKICAYAVALGAEAYLSPWSDCDGHYDEVSEAMAKAAVEGDLPSLLDLGNTYGVALENDGLPQYCDDGVAPAR